MSNSNTLIIAIDGYACTGKSTLARLLAQRLKFKHVNSGLIYRYFAWKLIQNNFTPENLISKSKEVKYAVGCFTTRRF